MSDLLFLIPAFGTGGFLACIFAILIWHRGGMFLGRYGRRHRVVGAAYLLWLTLGYADATLGLLSKVLVFDAVLGVLGTSLAVTAALDFGKQHSEKKVQNVASGPLGQDSTVTTEEMWEHSFYQGLNLAQVMYFHVVGHFESTAIRVALALVPASAWLLRSRFPVNSFSANYSKGGTDSKTVTSIMYRLKKYQYLLYKHALFYGLNAGVAISGDELATQPYFRWYWLLLNTAYTMEFFLQTLVKRRYLQQWKMLALNQFLMVVAVLPALHVLIGHGLLLPAALSLALNFLRRGYEFSNALVVLGFSCISRNAQTWMLPVA